MAVTKATQTQSNILGLVISLLRAFGLTFLPLAGMHRPDTDVGVYGVVTPNTPLRTWDAEVFKDDILHFTPKIVDTLKVSSVMVYTTPGGTRSIPSIV